MNRSLKTLGLGALAACIMTTAAVTAPPAIPATPAPVLDVISVQPFQLDREYKNYWRAERPMAKSGYILVLRVEPDLVYPRQQPEPVLYVGDTTAERVNVGYRSGHVVAVLAGVIDDPTHPDYIDLTKTPMWFGTPELPERVDAKMIEREADLARRAGIKPFSAQRITKARQVGGEAMNLPSKTELINEAMLLIRRYSPQERDLVEGHLMPEATP